MTCSAARRWGGDGWDMAEVDHSSNPLASVAALAAFSNRLGRTPDNLRSRA